VLPGFPALENRCTADLAGAGHQGITWEQCGKFDAQNDVTQDGLDFPIDRARVRFARAIRCWAVTSDSPAQPRIGSGPFPRSSDLALPSPFFRGYPRAVRGLMVLDAFSVTPLILLTLSRVPAGNEYIGDTCPVCQPRDFTPAPE
jgi:hypothetical protein